MSGDSISFSSEAMAQVVRPEKYDEPIKCEHCGNERYRKESCEYCLKT